MEASLASGHSAQKVGCSVLLLSFFLPDIHQTHRAPAVAILAFGEFLRANQAVDLGVF